MIFRSPRPKTEQGALFTGITVRSTVIEWLRCRCWSLFSGIALPGVARVTSWTGVRPRSRSRRAGQEPRGDFTSPGRGQKGGPPVNDPAQ